MNRLIPFTFFVFMVCFPAASSKLLLSPGSVFYLFMRVVYVLQPSRGRHKRLEVDVHSVLAVEYPDLPVLDRVLELHGALRHRRK